MDETDTVSLKFKQAADDSLSLTSLNADSIFIEGTVTSILSWVSGGLHSLGGAGTHIRASGGTGRGSPKPAKAPGP